MPRGYRVPIATSGGVPATTNMPLSVSAHPLRSGSAIPTLTDRPSPHLSWEELVCHDGTPYPPQWRDRAQELAAMFEAFRSAMGDRPIQIASAYRTPVWNRKHGGAAKSQHLEGRALDCRPPTGISNAAFRDRAKRFALRDQRVGGIGLYGWGVHLDIRPHRTLVAWNRVPAGTRLHDRRSA